MEPSKNNSINNSANNEDRLRLMLSGSSPPNERSPLIDFEKKNKDRRESTNDVLDLVMANQAAKDLDLDDFLDQSIEDDV